MTAARRRHRNVLTNKIIRPDHPRGIRLRRSESHAVFRQKDVLPAGGTHCMAFSYVYGADRPVSPVSLLQKSGDLDDTAVEHAHGLPRLYSGEKLVA